VTCGADIKTLGGVPSRADGIGACGDGLGFEGLDRLLQAHLCRDDALEIVLEGHLFDQPPGKFQADRFRDSQGLFA